MPESKWSVADARAVRGTGFDLVTFEVAAAVFARDKECVAAKLDPKHVCRDKWGAAHKPNIVRLLTLDHVKDVMRVGDPVLKRGAARKRRYRAPSDVGHLIAICWNGHITSGWAGSHRREIREYLAAANSPAQQPVSGQSGAKTP